MEVTANVPQAAHLRIVIASAGDELFFSKTAELIEEVSSVRYPAHSMSMCDYLATHERLDCVGFIVIQSCFFQDDFFKRNFIPQEKQDKVSEEAIQNARISALMTSCKEMSSRESPLDTNTVFILNTKEYELFNDLCELLNIDKTLMFPSEEDLIAHYSYASDFLNSRRAFRQRRLRGETQ